MTKPKVLVTRRWPAAVEAQLSEHFDTVLNVSDMPLTPDDFKAALASYDAVLPTVTDKIGAPALEIAKPQTKILANYGVGFSHIDMARVSDHGICVTNTPDVLSECTADLAMTLLLMVARRAGEGEREVREGQWTGWRPTHLVGTKVSGKTLGIIGMGRIGQAVARRAHAFGMQVHYHNRKRLHKQTESALEATYWESLDQMVARMDVISINCPHTPSTFHLMNARRLKLMKPDAVIVNTSRGEVVDENALTRMLRAGEIKGAGLDVYEHGAEINPRLRELENVVLLPHMGSATMEGRIEMGEKVIINIKTFDDGHRPPDQVVPSMI